VAQGTAPAHQHNGHDASHRTGEGVRNNSSNNARTEFSVRAFLFSQFKGCVSTIDRIGARHLCRSAQLHSKRTENSDDLLASNVEAD
jgi:hypothetical protein